MALTSLPPVKSSPLKTRLASTLPALSLMMRINGPSTLASSPLIESAALTIRSFAGSFASPSPIIVLWALKLAGGPILAERVPLLS